MLTDLLNALCTTIALAWIASDIVMYAARTNGDGRAPKVVRLTHKILGHAYLPSMTGLAIIDLVGGRFGIADIISLAGGVLAWVLREKDDDDWWKKLSDKASGVVKNLGHRLTVVPEPAGAA